MWRKKDDRFWSLEEEGVEGEARVIEVDGGYRAILEVKDTEYGMKIAEEREFFQSERKAEEFLKDKMEEVY